MSRWPEVPLREVLSEYREFIDNPRARPYAKLSVKLYGKGVVLDAPADGAALKMKKHQLARAGQVILSEIWGKKGAIGLVPPDGDGALCTSHFFLFDINRDRVLPGWLAAIFRANYLEKQLSGGAFGTTGYAAVRPKTLLSAQVPLPPLAEQKRLVARIENLGAQIKAARNLRQRAIADAEALPASALRRWVQDREPTGTLADVLSEKPRNGWSARCDNAADGIPVLSLAAVTGFTYRGNEFKRTSLFAPKEGHFWLRPGDLLITRSNTPELVGHVAIYDGDPAPCIFPDLMMRLVVDGVRAESRFVWYWLQSTAARDFVVRNAKGTSPSMKKVSQGTVMAIPFPVSLSLREQRGIVARLDHLRAKADALKTLQEKTAAELDALMPSILDKAFRGEL